MSEQHVAEPDDQEARDAAERLRAVGVDVRWDGEFWLICDAREGTAMSARATREDLLAVAAEEAAGDGDGEA